jgi:hypothetical protein
MGIFCVNITLLILHPTCTMSLFWLRGFFEVPMHVLPPSNRFLTNGNHSRLKVGKCTPSHTAHQNFLLGLFSSTSAPNTASRTVCNYYIIIQALHRNIGNFCWSSISARGPAKNFHCFGEAQVGL